MVSVSKYTYLPTAAMLALAIVFAVPAVRHWRERPPAPPPRPQPLRASWTPPEGTAAGSGGDYVFGLAVAADGRTLGYPALRAGVASLKIEGRLKSPEYVASITRVYRQALDRLKTANGAGESRVPEPERYELQMAFSRGLHTGWFGGINNQELVHARFGTKRGVLVGEVTRVARELEAQVWPLIEAGKIRVVTGRTFPLAQAAAAHAMMESAGHTGKILLTVAGT